MKVTQTKINNKIKFYFFISNEIQGLTLHFKFITFYLKFLALNYKYLTFNCKYLTFNCKFVCLILYL